MAKGQIRSSHEAKKPKKMKPKGVPAAVPSSVTTVADIAKKK